MNKAVRFALALVAGYILGTLIGIALFFSYANAQMRVNERVVLTTANSTVLRGAVTEASVASLMTDLQSPTCKVGRK